MKKMSIFQNRQLCTANGAPAPNKSGAVFYAFWKNEGANGWSYSPCSWKNEGVNGWTNSSCSWKNEGYSGWTNSSSSGK